jgi:hypothetical protein
MSDTEILERVAGLWIELGGDAEGVPWCWKDLRAEVKRQLSQNITEHDRASQNND